MRTVSETSRIEDMPTEQMPLLDDLMPWSVPALRLGRPWVVAPEPGTLRARWAALAGAQPAERDRLFAPSRSRTPHTAVVALPGQSTVTRGFAQLSGPCPEPVRVLHEPFDEQWILPDHRVIDQARPELWRVRGEQQVFLIEHGLGRGPTGPAVAASALLPQGASPGGRPGRIRPLFRRPGGVEPNVLPGLMPWLSARYGCDVTPAAVMSWVLAAARFGPAGCAVPLPRRSEHWRQGVVLGHRLLAVHLGGAAGEERPRLPGGRRPYVREAVPAHPEGLHYVAAEETLHLGSGRVSPVAAAAWDFQVSGVRVLERWFASRTAHRRADGLAAIAPAQWPQEWTSQLLNLISTLTLLAELAPKQAELTDEPGITAEELHKAGLLPTPQTARRPASVLDHREEGPDGQFALL
ncbi:type ISP restriction/modification enzyme [Streptomyces sp. NPDC006879]|uniref:type ISP restriction/modification enzyme n=1 Tax=Streptomyces sp. NPDC006879 TaxID=3364767 RepID=UPI0036CD2DB4